MVVHYRNIRNFIDHVFPIRRSTVGDVSLYGQEYNHTTWQLAAMNMAIRGLGFDFGKEPADTFTND